MLLLPEEINKTPRINFSAELFSTMLKEAVSITIGGGKSAVSKRQVCPHTSRKH